MRSIFISLLFCTACRDKSSAVVNSDNTPPVADAGSDQTLSADEEIRLDGGGSFDPDGDALSYSWSFSRVPEGSSLLENSSAFSTNNMATAITSFVPDTMGTYIVALAVTDAKGVTSSPDSVIISVSEGALPIAVAGVDQNVVEGETVVLDGSGSYDPLGRSLTYEWGVASAPAGSTAASSAASQINTVSTKTARMAMELSGGADLLRIFMSLPLQVLSSSISRVHVQLRDTKVAEQISEVELQWDERWEN